MIYTKDLWLEALVTEGVAFRAAVAELPLSAEVPSCPGWTVADLVHHLGSMYRYVREHTARGVTTPPERRLADYEAEPHAGKLRAWWEEQLYETLDALRALEPDAPAWNWAPQPKQAAFWQRRVAHETSLHRWDAQMATGRAEPIEARLAADGVSEALESFALAGLRHAKEPRSGMVELHSTDPEQTWYVHLRGEALALLDADSLLDPEEHYPTVTAFGPASDIQLALWGRIGLDILELDGDLEAVASLQIRS